MATIKAIEGRSVHQIQSGQVIVDLVSVCKELVENSVDAGATSVEVRFKNSGLDAIEVQDNGSGVSPDDFETIALKHYTSKLATYDDLAKLQTFGFRGEALSSLCALSNFHVVTARASDGPKGTKLDFEQSGKLKGTSVVAAKQGTSVVVETLFHNLPVRRKELEKNVKREYNKVLSLLNAYACISTGVKFTVTNQPPKGKKTVAFATNGNPTTRENISNVYGAKAVSALIPLNLSFEMEFTNASTATQSAKNWSSQEYAGARAVKIEGHVSRPVFGEGRQTPDRQMFFVNSRPCNLPQVARAFNEVYKSFNITQSPFVFANIKLDTNAYDVNVSPDKRTIMLHDQTTLLQNLKDSLVNLFEGHDQSVPQAQLLVEQQLFPAFKPPMFRRSAGNSKVPLLEDDDEAGSDIETPNHSNSRLRTSSSPNTPLMPSNDTEFIKASLIERFVGRNSIGRDVRPSAIIQGKTTGNGLRITREPDEHMSSTRCLALLEADSDQPVSIEVPQTTSFEGVQAQIDTDLMFSELAKPVQDFNERMSSRAVHQAKLRQSLDEYDVQLVEAEAEAEAEAEDQTIPKVSQKSLNNVSRSIIQDAYDHMRPMRTPLRQATITIGDTTTTTTTGSYSEALSAKRARIYTPKFSLSGRPLEQIPKSSGQRLRSFAAPGTQIEIGDEEDTGEPSEEDACEALDPTESQSSQVTRSRAVIEVPRSDKVVQHSDSSDEADSGKALEKTRDDGPNHDQSSDNEYIDESQKKAQEEAKIAQMIADAETAAARPTELNLKRATKLFKMPPKKYWTINLECIVKTDCQTIKQQIGKTQLMTKSGEMSVEDTIALLDPTQEDAEERLSLTVTKQDFGNMLIIGQFNLGFIIAVRPPTSTSPTPDLFIIDQHASDEKYNFERLSATTTLVSQRLVHPHPLELTAIEIELILANKHALTANGFAIELDLHSENDAISRVKLTSLPMSREITFTPRDLEELLALVMDNPTCSVSTPLSYVPRPSKVRKLLASRACRSSVMIGKTLQQPRMREIVRHMGSMDKPWSCPHGRPTMRHLYSLEKWRGWQEGDGVIGVSPISEKTDWKSWLGKRKK